MTFLLQERDPFDLTPENGVSKPIGGFSENVSAAYQGARMNDQAYSEATILKDQWGPIVDMVNERSGGKSFFNPANYLSSGFFDASASEGNAQRQYQYTAAQIVKFINQNKEAYPELQWVTHDEVLNRGKQAAIKARQNLMDLEGRSPGGLNTIGRFVGAIGGAATDPFNWQGGLAVRTSGSLLSMSFKEAFVNAGLESMAQSGVQKWYKELGYEYTPEQFWYSVAAAGAFGGAMPGALKIGGKTISLTTDQMRKGYDALVKSGAHKPSEVELSALRQSENIVEDMKANPLVDAVEHETRLNEAKAAVDSGEPPPISDAPASPLKPTRSVNEADNLDGLIYKFDPQTIKVDAETFQFKAGGDEFGVTERLQGVTQWDPIKAGQVTIYEYADGGRFVADGHQRVGLARRIQSQDPTQEVALYGHLLRETDGITPEMARVIAAVKNIAEGTGTAIDAAKVLRVAPERIGELPPRSALVRQAQGLVLLSDKAFGAVVNQVIPANYAALVGRLVPEDEGLQDAAIAILAKTDPANEFQAEAIIRQVRDAGAQTMKQEGLFGEEIITESFFTERARILDRAQKQLRQDKAAFSTLTRNAERLEAEGNQLARQANEKRTANDTQAIALLQALANIRGPISDALSAAARSARESGSYAEPTRNFVDAVRRAAESGDFDRVSSGDVGQLVDAPTQSRTAKDVSERVVDDFDEPAGVGAKDQGDQIEADLFGQRDPVREAVQEDINLRQDLKRQLDEGAAEADIDNHPAVVKAIEEAKAIQETHLVEGYGSDLWLSSREFKIGDEAVVGYSSAVERLFERARRLAWTDEGKAAPDVPTKYEKKAVIVLGPPAAGKSTIANPIAQKMGAVILDPDDIKKAMPEYKNGIGANAVHEESSYITSLVEQVAVGSGANVLIPKVGSNPKSVKGLIERLRQNGYEIDLVDMKVDYQEARRRMFVRFVDTGRLVPPNYVREVGNNPGKTFDTLKAEGAADGYTRIDNNVPQGAERPILEDTRNLLDGTELRLRDGGEPGFGYGAERSITETGARDLKEAEPEIDMDLEVPVDLRVDPETGEIAAQTVTLRQIQDDIAQDQKMLDRLRGCAK